MRKILLFVALLHGVLFAQTVQSGYVNYVTSAPSGSCSQNNRVRVVMGAGTVYSCQSGTWATVGGGGGGSGTVTSVGLTVNSTSPSGIFTVSGSPVTTAGALDVAIAGTSGGIPYFSSATVISSSGVLTTSRLVLGGGAAATPTVLGSLGTTTTLLHGNAAGAPTFATVTEADQTLADNTTNNASTSAHGYLLKLNNSATSFINGQGAWATPTVTPSYPVTVAGTVTSGGIPYFSSTTVETSSALLTVNSPVLGGGAGAAPSTSTGLTFDGTHILTLSVAGSGAGTLALSGNTSGTATFAAPAVAGTTTNGVTMSNVLLGPAGGATTPTYSFSGSTGTGMWQTGGILVFNQTGGSTIFQSGGTNVLTISGTASLNPSTDVATSLGDATHHFTKAFMSNCAASGTAANPSVVTCGASASGIVYCDVAASAGTCQVNTTAVTTNSEILITPSGATTDGTLLSKTCNTSITAGAVPILAAKANGASFTVNVPTVVTNGACYHYVVVN